MTIPESMTTPVLSFMHQLGSSRDPGGPVFSVSVSDSLTTPTVYSASESTLGWEQVWIDLSRWAGEAVTVAFELHQEAGQPYRWLYLDDVSLGPAHPDLYAGIYTPFIQAAPGREITYELTYGNRGGAPAAQAVLTLSLPEGVSFVSDSQPPQVNGNTLTWSLGDLSANSGPVTVTVSAVVKPNASPPRWQDSPVEISSQAAELEKANNQSKASVYIGYRLSLPVIFRCTLRWKPGGACCGTPASPER